VIKSFLAGALGGAVVVWLWGDRLRDAVDAATLRVRTRTAEQLHGVAATLESVADTVDQGLSGAAQPRVS
jgi:hypothetical protein